MEEEPLITKVVKPSLKGNICYSVDAEPAFIAEVVEVNVPDSITVFQTKSEKRYNFH